MKILGHTHTSYLCEVSKDEMHKLTGKVEGYNSNAHPAGNIVNVLPRVRHIEAMEHTVDQRKRAAEALRAAAIVIETVPAAFTEHPPTPPTP